jgi:hypothetical protein
MTPVDSNRPRSPPFFTLSFSLSRSRAATTNCQAINADDKNLTLFFYPRKTNALLVLVFTIASQIISLSLFLSLSPCHINCAQSMEFYAKILNIFHKQLVCQRCII